GADGRLLRRGAGTAHAAGGRRLLRLADAADADVLARRRGRRRPAAGAGRRRLAGGRDGVPDRPADPRARAHAAAAPRRRPPVGAARRGARMTAAAPPPRRPALLARERA